MYTSDNTSKLLGKDRDSQKRLCRSFSAVSGYINLMKGLNNCLILLSECEEDVINHHRRGLLDMNQELLPVPKTIDVYLLGHLMQL